MVTMVSSRLAATMGFAGGAGETAFVRTDATRPSLRLTRLTRRGRMVAVGVSALLVGALSMTLATAAQASRDGAAPGGSAHSGSASAGKYVTKVTVRPGESLYSLAEAYDPDADPRVVVQQVLQLNSLSGYQIQPGEVLWMPRG